MEVRLEEAKKVAAFRDLPSMSILSSSDAEEETIRFFLPRLAAAVRDRKRLSVAAICGIVVGPAVTGPAAGVLPIFDLLIFGLRPTFRSLAACSDSERDVFDRSRKGDLIPFLRCPANSVVRENGSIMPDLSSSVPASDPEKRLFGTVALVASE